ncbi:MAG: peptide-methionine (S)-S-oxide reductase MsrA [Thiolinea sp.]
MKRFFRHLLQTLVTTALLGAATLQSVQAKTDTLILAGGCFWCVESDFEKLPGVDTVVSGYTGGTVENPSYEQVSSHTTGHFEAVTITFDDEKVSLRSLVDYYWKTIDPTDPEGQFCDKGSPYRTALFYQNEAQKTVFAESLAAVTDSKPFADPIVTQILPAKPFYPAEDYHQGYYQKNPLRYNYYRFSCGREARIQSLWGEVASKQFAH